MVFLWRVRIGWALRGETTRRYSSESSLCISDVCHRVAVRAVAVGSASVSLLPIKRTTVESEYPPEAELMSRVQGGDVGIGQENGTKLMRGL